MAFESSDQVLRIYIKDANYAIIGDDRQQRAFFIQLKLADRGFDLYSLQQFVAFKVPELNVSDRQ